ncbi:hypothetical protein BDW60DRAFT_172304 [Aspergillus nidulans var. acristatus]
MSKPSILSYSDLESKARKRAYRACDCPHRKRIPALEAEPSCEVNLLAVTDCHSSFHTSVSSRMHRSMIHC